LGKCSQFRVAIGRVGMQQTARNLKRLPYPITLSSPGIPTIVLHYTRLGEITDDIDDARVYGGIHFRYDQDAGGRQGQRIGSFVFSHKLQPAAGSGQGEDQDQDGCSE